MKRSELTFEEFGDPAGEPLMFFHGWPGSGGQGRLLDDAAKLHGFRVIAPDRPGIGGSKFVATRSLLDWPAQVRELASDLGLESVAVIGVSGGGPYALATAWNAPEIVRRVSIVCGAPHIAQLATRGELHPAYRLLLRWHAKNPRGVRWLFRAASPFVRWKDAAEFFHATRIFLERPDAAALEKRARFEVVFGSQKRAFERPEGVFVDASIYARPWGFSPREIRVPVQFWHGMKDRNFHYSLAVKLAEEIPGASIELVEEAGHFSLPIEHATRILEKLAAGRTDLPARKAPGR